MASYAVSRDSLSIHQCNHPHSTRWQSRTALGTYTCHCKGCHSQFHNTHQDMLYLWIVAPFSFTTSNQNIYSNHSDRFNETKFTMNHKHELKIERIVYSLLLQNGSNQPVWQPSAHVPFTCSQVRSFAQCPHRPEQLDP